MRARAAFGLGLASLLCSCTLLGGGEDFRGEPVVTGEAQAPSAATVVEERAPLADAQRKGDCFSAALDELQGATEAVLKDQGFAVAVLGSSLRASRRLDVDGKDAVTVAESRYSVSVDPASGADAPLSLRLRLSMSMIDSSACLSGRASTVGFAFADGEFERFMVDLRKSVAIEIGRQRAIVGPVPSALAE